MRERISSMSIPASGTPVVLVRLLSKSKGKIKRKREDRRVKRKKIKK
jgi:hypothetical protein